MISIQYFASIRESLGTSNVEIEKPASVTSVQDLIDYLLETNPGFDKVFNAQKKVLVAVNQTIVGREHLLHADDEVAFFPPMTGG